MRIPTISPRSAGLLLPVAVLLTLSAFTAVTSSNAAVDSSVMASYDYGDELVAADYPTRDQSSDEGSPVDQEFDSRHEIVKSTASFELLGYPGGKQKPSRNPTSTPTVARTPTAKPTTPPAATATAVPSPTATMSPTTPPATATSIPSPTAVPTVATATPPPPPATSGGPRLNVHPSSSAPGWSGWSEAPVFWFGRATENDNYADIRVAYDSQNLYINATIVDYYLWWDGNGTSDPRQYDSLGLYLSTGPQGQTPVSTDYAFVSGYRFWPEGNDPRWHLQARGNGSAWDYGWRPTTQWTDSTGARWYNSGPNDNSDRDAGWTTTMTIPWATLGRSGPPASGSAWAMGLKIFDRDAATPAPVQPNAVWPAGMVDASPVSWGTIAFDPPAYSPAVGQPSGTTTLRGGLSAVKDAYVGGGGTCEGGVWGGGDIPHPGADLFVQNETDVSDFPCFSRSYLWFDTSPIPAGKKILSASLTLHEYGGSDPSQARPSVIQLYSVSDNWDPATLTWNNAPMADENLSSTVVPVLPGFPGWPGVANSWDATQAVAEAYATGKPVNIALYEADLDYHSGKYFTSSAAGDWDEVGRPTLTITWGS